MKLTLIKPNMGRIRSGPYVDEGRMEPLQLGILAGMCPEGVDVELFDDRCETIPFDRPTDLVALTVESFTARRAYQIATEYRNRGVPVILGGMHVTLLPTEAKLYADSIVVGDAEIIWNELMEDAKNGHLKSVYHGHRTQGVPQAGILPRRELYRGKDYLPISLLQFGRGCPNACHYCAVSSYFKKIHRFRPVKEVLKEIEKSPQRIFFFVDDNIVANREAAKVLFQSLIPLKIQWVGQGSIDMVYDAELMDLLCASGCRGNVIGFESIHPESLRGMNKVINLHQFDQYDKEIRILKSYHLQTWAAFLIGHDEDTSQSLQETLDFALKHQFTFAAFNTLMPYPGTLLYKKMEEEKRLLYDGKWWLHPDYRFNHASYIPKNMAPDELTTASFELRKKWNSLSSVLWRFLDRKTNMASLSNMAIYWAYNPLFRRETFKKQGMRLGLNSDFPKS